ncbi:MAG TPA: glutamate-5-semialdehyde dehydrogenase [Candidatus Magasanikbacteria bacterium]|nr:MAG: glutamate-5-semialdehyde dehydrogenase [Candidatus Magasanikbacteria bacterium RIFOXYC2_FULL_39_8]HAT03398.1 glutamate-5-semialdehyde dehydrogenase [Candidatus Magasanikbacteria bacterium]
MNIKEQLQKTQAASRELVLLSEEKINEVLNELAVAIDKNNKTILEANEKDLARLDANDPTYDRLALDDKRLKGIALDIKNVAHLPYPVGKILEERTLESGLHLQKISVSLGVVGVIYEARPNVTFDVFSLCFKSGNACVLKGGSDARDSNEAIVHVIHDVLEKHNVSKDILLLLPSNRESVKELFTAKKYVDVIIPRGSQSLIHFVRENSRIPVIETGAGIVHTYIDKSADIEQASRIIFNAKTRRVSVCNALDCLIIHDELLDKLSLLVSELASKQVIIYADEKSYKALENHYPKELLAHATGDSFGTEFLSLKMAIKTVSNVEEAVEHITTYSSKHSEAIIAENQEVCEYFLKHVDAAAVYVNTSTAFTDGAQFGLGAEIGISTQKLHARGPMGLKELTSYKYVVRGDGEIRN